MFKKYTSLLIGLFFATSACLAPTKKYRGYGGLFQAAISFGIGQFGGAAAAANPSCSAESMQAEKTIAIEPIFDLKTTKNTFTNYRHKSPNKHYTVYFSAVKPSFLRIDKEDKMEEGDSLSSKHNFDFSYGVSSRTFSSNNLYFAVGLKNGEILIYENAKITFIQILHKKHSHSIFSSAIIQDLDFSPDCKYIASLGSDNSIKIWTIEDDEPVREIQYPKTSTISHIDMIKFSKCGNFIVIAGDKNLKIFDLSQDKILFNHDFEFQISDLHRLQATDEIIVQTLGSNTTLNVPNHFFRIIF